MRFALRLCGTFPLTNTTSTWLGKTTNAVTYQIGPTTVPGTNGLNLSATGYIYEAGESVILSTSGPLLHTSLTGVVFTNTMPLRSYALNGLSSGNNTIYTVPAGKHPVAPTGNGFTFQYFNGSGSGRQVVFYLVPSGITLDDNTRVTSTAVTSGTGGSYTAINGAMFPGDSFVINTDANTATQHAFITVVETP